MPTGLRLRQVALVASDGVGVATHLQDTFGWPEPFHDPGVAEFGLTNSVFEVGDAFVEVVAPARPGTAAGRHLERLGGDGGYMAIFQVANLEDAQRRLCELGVTVVWSVDLPDMATRHLDPRNVPGAIVSLDWADPPESWRWAGPRWVGQEPAHSVGGLSAVTVEVDSPADVARRWADVLGLVPDGTTISLGDTAQTIRFSEPANRAARGITAVSITGESRRGPVMIGGVEFTVEEER